VCGARARRLPHPDLGRGGEGDSRDLGGPGTRVGRHRVCEGGAVSAGQAHNVLSRLQREGLMGTIGKGQGVRRKVQNPTELLDWLARVPAARKIHERRAAYLYAPDPDALITRLSFHGVQSGSVTH